jgi:ADP-ribose pyrophosphatase YjhB (NUDIX family)
MNNVPMSEYYQEIRGKVGSELLMMPSVAAVIRNKEDEILFIRKPEESLWGLPAGAIEPGERPGRTLRREVYEETGLMVHPTTILGVFGGGKYRYEYNNGDQVEYTVIVFECSIIRGTLRAMDGEVEEFKFFKESELPEMAIPYPVEIFKKDREVTKTIFE